MKPGSKRLHKYALQLGYEEEGVDGSGHLVYRHRHTKERVRITSGCYEGPAYYAYLASLENGAGMKPHNAVDNEPRQKKPKKRKRGELAEQHARAKAERDRERILARIEANEKNGPTANPAQLAAERQRRMVAALLVDHRYHELKQVEALMR